MISNLGRTIRIRWLSFPYRCGGWQSCSFGIIPGVFCTVLVNFVIGYILFAKNPPKLLYLHNMNIRGAYCLDIYGDLLTKDVRRTAADYKGQKMHRWVLLVSIILCGQLSIKYCLFSLWLFSAIFIKLLYIYNLRSLDFNLTITKRMFLINWSPLSIYIDIFLCKSLKISKIL